MSTPALEPLVPAAARLVSVDGKAYPLESAHLLARAEGGIASTTLAQVFANPHDEPLEVLYTLPLPADGAVLGYTIEIGERIIRGEVQPREQASAAYKRALFEGRTAGLLEQHRADTFEQRLGNVPPRTPVRVSIDVLHPLAFLTPEHAGSDLPRVTEEPTARDMESRFRMRAPQWEFRFPTVVGVRYHGAPGRVSDQEALSPDRGASGEIPTRVELTLTIADESGHAAWSPSHRIQLAPDGVVTFAGDERLDRDVVVRWTAATQEVGVHVVEGAGLPGDDGRYALVTVVPPAAPQLTFHRDLVVLLDASGSMTGLPLELARLVVGDLLRSLATGDRFELLAFSSDVRSLTRPRTAFDERALASALEALARLEAGGGTEMATAIARAMRPAGEDAQRQVVLVTDGEIGFEHEVIARVAAQQNVRLHVVGVGHAPNRALTQQAAAAGRGLELLAASHADADAAARRLVAGTASPVLTQLAVSGTAIAGRTPERLRDVFAGQPLVLAVELSREGGSFELRGTRAGSSAPWVRGLAIPPAAAGDGLGRTPLPIGALYGREVVARLELERAGAADQDFDRDGRGAVAARDADIERVAMRHRIVSRRTSLVAIAEEPSVDPRAPRRRERLAVEVPAGVSAEGVGLTGAGTGAELADLHFMLEMELSRTHATPPIVMRHSEKPREDVARAAAPPPPSAPRGPRPPEWFPHEWAAPEVVSVHWPEPDVIVVELRVPFEGFALPERRVDVRLAEADGTEIVVRGHVLAERSSPAGPSRFGTLVRLALRLDAGSAWPAGREVTLEWTGASPDPKRGARELPTRILVRIPERPEGEPAPGESPGPPA